jgi:beta-galactosidase
VSPRDGALLLNGCPIKLRGVNRHEFNAWKGIGAFSSFPSPALTPALAVVDHEAAPSPTNESSSKREAVRDVLMIKQSNFNAIRTSHYPNDAFFYLLCDHLGVYVVDEANIETHGLWDHFSDNPTHVAHQPQPL